MALIAGGAEAVGPTDKQRYNALLVLADPADTVASIVFRVAAGTQVRCKATSNFRTCTHVLGGRHETVVRSMLLRAYLLAEKVASVFIYVCTYPMLLMPPPPPPTSPLCTCFTKLR